MHAPVPAATAPSGLAQPLGRPRPLVFLAEDDADMRHALSDALRDAGFDVLSASNGHEMLKLLTAASNREVPLPDAFVMDVRMPKCSGIDVLGALKLAGWPQPVVMVTGFGDLGVHERAASQGASVILDKPFDSDDLVEMLDLLLSLSRGDVARPLGAAHASDDELAPPATLPPPTVRRPRGRRRDRSSP